MAEPTDIHGVRYFLLDEENDPILCSQAAWEEASAGGALMVAQDDVPGGRVWTQFTGVDFGDDDPPRLFETHSLIGSDGLMERSYTTWDEAEAGHREVVARFAPPSGDVIQFPKG
jgi:hypothetical protein